MVGLGKIDLWNEIYIESQGGGGGACMIIFSLNTQKCGCFNCILIVLDGCAEL